MMYSNRFVAAIKVAGQILREQGNIVTIPFGSEYSVLLKNLHSVRAQVKVSVDGTDATEGTWLVLLPNSTLELERYIRNGNMLRGNRFKFIERTGAIESNRGVGAEDGLIRVEYKFEQVVREVVRTHYRDEYVPVPRPCPLPPPYPRPWPYIWYGTQTNTLVTETTPTANFLGSVTRSTVPTRGLRTSKLPPRPTMSASTARSMNRVANDMGITVPGSESSQQFHSVSGFHCEASDVLVLVLRGDVAGRRVAKAVTVKHKPKCTTCGKVNKGGASFCSECGTALVVI